MAKGRNTQALLGLLGAGLAAKALSTVPLERQGDTKGNKELIRKRGFTNAYRSFNNPESVDSEAPPDSPSLVLSGDGTPVRAGDGFLRSQQYKKGGMTASKRADGIAQRGKTRGRMR